MKSSAVIRSYLVAAVCLLVLPAGSTEQDIPPITDLKAVSDGDPWLTNLQWEIPQFDVPEGRDPMALSYDFRYCYSPLNEFRWSHASPIILYDPPAVTWRGNVSLDIFANGYDDPGTGDDIVQTDRLFIRASLWIEVQYWEYLIPVKQGVPHQEIKFEVWNGGDRVDFNSAPIYTDRYGEAEWVSCDLTDSSVWEPFLAKIMWDGGSVELRDGQVVTSVALMDTVTKWCQQGWVFYDPHASWLACGNIVDYFDSDIYYRFSLPESAVVEDGVTVNLETTFVIPTFVGVNPAVLPDPLVSYNMYQDSGPPLVELAKPVYVTIDYSTRMPTRAGVGESSLRAYHYDDDLAEWMLIDPDSTVLNRVGHTISFPIHELGFYALGVEIDSDDDGLGDYEELGYGMDPYDGDQDEDGIIDGDEIWFHKSNPFDPLKVLGCDQNTQGEHASEPPTWYWIAGRIVGEGMESPLSNSTYIGPPLDVDFAEWWSGPGVKFGDAQAGDLDLDGDQDLVYCGELASGSPTTQVYKNVEGVMTLSQELPGVENTGSGCLALGDFDGDGDLDLAMAGMTETERIARVYQNDGSGTFIWDESQVLLPVNNASLAWGDFDLDGDQDLILSGHDGSVPAANLYVNDPPGTLTPDAGSVLTGLTGGSSDWADWDRDGDLDLMMTGHDGTARRTIFYRNDPPGTLTADGDHGVPGVNLSDAAWGDYDGDGDLDLAVTGEAATGGPRLARVYRNDGAGGLTQVVDLMTTYRSSCAWGDMDLDHDLDVAFCGYNGTDLYTRIYEYTGSDFVMRSFSLADVHEGSLEFVDMDFDGDLDLLLTGAQWSDRFVKIYRNMGVETLTVSVADQNDLGSAGAGAGQAPGLLTNNPDPFNPQTTITYGLARVSDVTLEVYDIQGRLVRTLVDARQEQGNHSVVWDGLDEQGNSVTSGLYFCRLVSGDATQAEKMILLE